MVTQIFTGSLTGPGTLVNLGSADNALVGVNATIAVTTVGSTIVGTGAGQSVRVAGIVSGPQTAILLGDSNTDVQISVSVAQSGYVSGSNAGIDIFGQLARVNNIGLIEGGLAGVSFFTSGITTSISRLFNAGTIIGTQNGVLAGGSGVLIENIGTITGVINAIGLGDGADTVINQGRIFGDVLLAGGNDLYDGRGGSVRGTIFAGSQNDIFKPGAGIEVINGGADIDRLDFRGSSAVRVALDGSIGNTGVAAGDSYLSIEQMYGSFFNDTLIGSSGADVLRGWLGDDRLNGGASGDLIYGGRGRDVITGGAGNDSFVFDFKNEASDIITDFTNLSGNNDRFRIDASNFGGGLTVGFLSSSKFQVRADNHAQDANDRFIFRTTDKTLWFDANGTAAGGLLLLADLQSNATMTAADILLF